MFNRTAFRSDCQHQLNGLEVWGKGNKKSDDLYCFCSVLLYLNPLQNTNNYTKSESLHLGLDFWGLYGQATLG